MATTKTSLRLRTYTKISFLCVTISRACRKQFRHNNSIFFEHKIKNVKLSFVNLNNKDRASEILTENCSWIRSFILSISLRLFTLGYGMDNYCGPFADF